MGFYSPQSLVADARRHGVTAHRAEINASLPHATLEADAHSTGGRAIRLGLAAISGIGDTLAHTIVDERDRDGPYRDQADLARRTPITAVQLETLATANAFFGFHSTRRDAIWAAGAAARNRAEHLPGSTVVAAPPALPGMSQLELVAADLDTTGISPNPHPAPLIRTYRNHPDAIAAADVRAIEPGTRILVGGIITHRQRPATAGGITFLNLEDETGMVNIIISPGLWKRHARTARNSSAMLIRGRLEIPTRPDGTPTPGIANINADHLTHIDLAVVTRSRDFR
jgi:error-prone DNA polymerase